MIGSLRFQVRYPDGRREELVVEGERALVGSGAQCEVRLSPEDADPEHLAFYAKKGALFAEKRALRGTVTVNGVPFLRGEPDLRSPFVIGRVQFLVTPIEGVVAKGRKSSPIRSYGMAIILFGAIYFALFKSKTADSAVTMPRNLPELWGTASVACPQKTSEPATRLAGDLILLAESKRERAPFFPQAGVAAVSLYREAASCMAIAGNREVVAQLTEESDSLSRDLVYEFRLARLRLERAIASQDWELARKQIQRLKGFLEGQGGEYVTWLNEMERRSAVHLTKKTDK